MKRSDPDVARDVGRAVFGVFALMIAAAVIGACSDARAQRPDSVGAVQLGPEACQKLAETVVMAAEARDTGARHQPYAALLARRFEAQRIHETARRIILREVKRVFTSGLDAGALELDLYTRCMTGPLGGQEI